MKKILITILALLLIPLPALAANTHSIDLELDQAEYLSIADASQTGLDLASDFTFEGWVKFESLPGSGTRRGFLSKGASTPNKAYFFDLVNLSGTLYLDLTLSNDGTSDASNRTTWTPSVDTWYHVAVSYDLAAGTAQFYVNGSAQGSAVAGGKTSLNNSNQPFTLGENNLNSTDYMDGLMDDWRVWSDIRTGTEISDNYQTELVGNEANLVGYWKLNNNANDETANNNDLTENNTPTYSTDVPFTGAAARRRIINW